MSCLTCHLEDCDNDCLLFEDFELRSSLEDYSNVITTGHEPSTSLQTSSTGLPLAIAASVDQNIVNPKLNADQNVSIHSLRTKTLIADIDPSSGSKDRFVIRAQSKSFGPSFQYGSGADVIQAELMSSLLLKVL